MLSGDNHGVHAFWGVVLVVLDGHLSLAVGTQIGQSAVLAHLGQLDGQLLSHRDGQGHQLRGLGTGIAEHHALIAGTVVQTVVLLTNAGFQALIHTLSDVGGLLINGGDDSAGVAVKAELGTVIADLANYLTGYLGDVHIAGGADLAHNVDKTGGDSGLTGYAGHLVFSEDSIQNSVRDLVTDFVGMSLSYGFRGK